MSKRSQRERGALMPLACSECGAEADPKTRHVSHFGWCPDAPTRNYLILLEEIAATTEACARRGTPATLPTVVETGRIGDLINRIDRALTTVRRANERQFRDAWNTEEG